MNPWLNQVIDGAQISNDWLSPIREQSLQTLKNSQWPNRRSERWKYTSLTALENFNTNNNANNNSVNSALAVGSINGLNAIELIFVNGKCQTNIKQLTLPNGLNISDFRDAPIAQQDKAKAVFNHSKPAHHLFGLVNDVMANEGLLISIDENCDIQTPIHIIHHNSEGDDSHLRVLVNIAAGAKATIIEQGHGESSSANTYFSEYVLDKNAQLEHTYLAMHTHLAIHISGCHFNLYDHAKLKSTVIAYGSQLSRLDIDVNHCGEHADAKLNAVYLLAESEHFDLHTTIEHAMPNGTTEENVRGVVGDKAKAVFNGRIHIHRNAQKTLAQLNNRNLLLSRRGQVNTKPELEIYADDVQCAHGATVAEMNEEDLYYLNSRGISLSKAKVMLNLGFIQELVNGISNQALKDWLEQLLRTRFLTMEVK